MRICPPAADFAANCFARGDGLSQGVVGEETGFEIVAVDRSNARRESGGDMFAVSVQLLQTDTASPAFESKGTVADCGEYEAFACAFWS